MSDTSANPQRLLELFERLRPQLLGPAFRRLHELQLSPSHHRVLHVLMCARPLPMKELAEHLQLTPPSVTALTRRLVETGLVDRRPHAEDSRVALLDLTAAGQRLHEELNAERLRSMSRLLSALTPEEQRSFLALFERMVLFEHLGPGADPAEPTNAPPPA